MGGFRPSPAFSRLYLIPGAYHCLYDTPDHRVNFVNFLTPLISWVQHGIAPTAIPADIGTPQGTITLQQKVRPYNALTPVVPAKGSLNGHYHYIGTYQVTHHLTPAITSLGRGQNLR
jgi:hypothetical protein